jgi:hypothetical protein
LPQPFWPVALAHTVRKKADRAGPRREARPGPIMMGGNRVVGPCYSRSFFRR